MSNPSKKFIVVLCTCPDAEIAGSLARKLVKEKLAACVNVLPGVTSVYRWEGKLQEDSEVMLVIKSSADCLARLKESISESHPYDVPEIIAVPITDGSEPYLDWVGQSVT